MRMFWFAIAVLLTLGVLAGVYDQPAVTGQVIANLPPVWDYPASEFSGSLELDLDNAFFDPDGSSLSYSVRSSDSVAAGIKGSVLVVDVIEPGHVWVTASDGTYQVVKKLVFI